MKKKVTLKFISEQSGFSASVVSRVINGRAREFRISKEAEEEILRIAEKFGYKANPVAVSLRVKRSSTIGLIIPSLDNPFFVNMTSILNRELAQREYNIILTESNDDPLTEEKMINQLLERNVDGILLIPCKGKDQNVALLEKTFKNGVPIICIDRYIQDSIVPFITTDNKNGAYNGVKFLIEKGHKKIACIQGLVDSTPNKDRKEGYLAALREQGLDPFYIGGNEFSVECGYRETKAILQKKEKPTAIFAMSSTIALGVMKATEESGYEIPKDFSLIGFDNNIFLDYLATPLTTIAQPVEEISEIASRVLVDHIDGEADLSEWKSLMLETEIVHRKSVKGNLL